MSSSKQILQGVPAVDRACEILALLEEAPQGVSVREVVDLGGLARATAYRTLNSLMKNNLVTQVQDGRFVLGPRLVTLGARVPVAGDWLRRLDLIRPALLELRDSVGEATKLSILDGDHAYCLLAESGTRSNSLSGAAGRRYPLHAGAASKILLAHASQEMRERILAGPLDRYTEVTLTDPSALREELEAAIRDGLARDRGEFNEGVHAVAAPVFAPSPATVGALSVAYLGPAQKDGGKRIADAVIDSARRLSAELCAERTSGTQLRRP